MKNIQSIPTLCDGTLFRSRLEARWSLFFGLLGIDWEYEPEHDYVDIGFYQTQYKPDFYLPDLDYWIEIKPAIPNDDEMNKMAGWAKGWHAAGFYIAYKLGRPSENTESARKFWYSKKRGRVFWDHSFWWTECSVCGAIELTHKGDPPATCEGRCYDYEDMLDLYENTNYAPVHESYPYSPHSPRILRAYEAALGAQFNDSPEQQRINRAQLANERANHRFEAGLETYATKKYGTCWRETENEDDVRDDFSDWLDYKNGGR